jgi:hypothetical protein
MNKLKKSIISIAGLMLVAFANGLSSTQAQNTRDKDVNVINTTTNPVPVVVQGMTKVMLPGPVQVGNGPGEPIPVSPQGVTNIRGSVDITGPVALQTSPRTPIYIVVAINPNNLFQEEVLVGLRPGNNQIVYYPDNFVVPTGKILLLKHIDADIQLPHPGVPIITLRRKLPLPNSPEATLPLLEHPQGNGQWSISQDLFLQMQPGFLLGVGFFRVGPLEESATMTLVLTGELVDP